MIPITGLFESHLTVARLDRSVAFYERGSDEIERQGERG